MNLKINKIYFQMNPKKILRSGPLFLTRYFKADEPHNNTFNLSQNNLNPANQSVIKYLESKSDQLCYLVGSDDPQLRVSIPYRFNPEKNVKNWQQKLMNQWKDKSFIFDIDPSFVIGRKRFFMKNYLENDVYKNSVESPNIFSKINPEYFLEIEQTLLDPETFISTDPDIMKIDDSPTTDQQAEQDRVLQLYQSDPQRFSRRLAKQFNVPAMYHKIIEEAMLTEKKIYFCGINQYVLRNFLASCFTLSELKGIFFQCLNYAYFKSPNPQHLTLYAHQLIYARNYHIIQKFQNGCILSSIAQISEDYVFFGKQYTTKSLTTDYQYINNYSKSVDKSLDTQKIEKNAILQVLLGNLWNQPFTVNRFPYLSQSYFDLNQDDKGAIEDIYHTNFTRYTGAIKVFYEKKKA